MGGGAGGGAAAAAAAGRDPKAAAEERGAEDFGLTALSWLVREQDKLLGQEEATAVLDFFFEMRRADAAYTCVGRTPKTIRAALEAHAAS